MSLTVEQGLANAGLSGQYHTPYYLQLRLSMFYVDTMPIHGAPMRRQLQECPETFCSPSDPHPLLLWHPEFWRRFLALEDIVRRAPRHSEQV